MFTGIVESRGTVLQASGARLKIGSDFEGLQLGESVAVNGVCLTVAEADAAAFSADISEQTRRRTSLGGLVAGQQVNLERAMTAGARFGGHIVQGHVDGVAHVAEIRELSGSVEMSFSVPEELEKYLVDKGSASVDGVSLTVASLSGCRFGVWLVPHTLESTNLGAKKPGDPVNIEVDILAKYVERLLMYPPSPRR